MKLVTACQYSKPSKDDPIARRTLVGYSDEPNVKHPVVEVQRKDNDLVYVRILAGDFAHLAEHLVSEVMSDLRTAKLLE